MIFLKEELFMSKKILIVDDNRDFIDLLGNMLVDKGYEVFSFSQSGDALDVIKQNDPNLDLIITDILMPEHDGFDIIKASKEYTGAKIIAMSGGGTFVSAEKSLETIEKNVNACLIKPVRMSELLDVVAKLIN